MQPGGGKCFFFIKNRINRPFLACAIEVFAVFIQQSGQTRARVKHLPKD